MIEAQLDALASQVAEISWEVVVSDNGSTDGLPALIERRANSFPVPLRVADASSRRGIPHARNVGAVAARGMRLAFCDCDDIVLPGWVQAAWDALQKAELVGGANRVLTPKGDANSPIINPECVAQGPTGPTVLGCNFAVRRDMYFRCGGFDESLPPYGMDDVDFSIRVNLQGGRVRPAPDMQILFRQTVDRKALLSKVFRSGMAEYVVWRHYGEIFTGRAAPLRLVLDLALFFPHYTGLLVRGALPPIPKIMRDGVTRVAHVAAHLQWVRSGGFGDQVLLSPSDDPLHAEVPLS